MISCSHVVNLPNAPKMGLLEDHVNYQDGATGGQQSIDGHPPCHFIVPRVALFVYLGVSVIERSSRRSALLHFYSFGIQKALSYNKLQNTG